MRITVFGASGKVGSLVVEEALRRGYEVTAFVHRHTLSAPSGNLAVATGSVYNEADVQKALRGSDAVISCLSSWHAPQKNVLTAAMERIIPAMREQNIARIVTLTGVGLQERPGRLYKTALRLLPFLPVAGKVFADADRHVRLLRQSGLAWTTLCSPVMSNLGRGTYRLETRQRLFLPTVSRKAIAAALLDQLDDRTYINRVVAIY